MIKPKNIIRQDRCMTFNDALKPLCLETDTLSLSLDAGLLQVRDGMNCGLVKRGFREHNTESH